MPGVGERVRFTVALTNAGPDPATSVEVSDLLPAGMVFDSGKPSQGSYNPGSGVWTVGTVKNKTVHTAHRRHGRLARAAHEHGGDQQFRSVRSEHLEQRGERFSGRLERRRCSWVGGYAARSAKATSGMESASSWVSACGDRPEETVLLR